MKKILMVLLLSFTSICLANGGENSSKDEAINELTQIMGLKEILDTTMEQTKSSVKKILSDIRSQVTVKFPNMSVKQEENLQVILDQYANTILKAIDTQTAAGIYVTEIANNMSEEEINYTLDFYRSPQGARARQAVGKASSKLNAYFLTQIEQATKVAYAKLTADLEKFTKELSENR
ncbi:MAG: hypothetical protein CSA21_01535 [Deltaproteobacteria bacterium]|nr:MAG: hypothetical protein CSA21_01535 [Deltaproteobacteria bacterium]